MKRVGGLTEQIAELDNLYLAYMKAKRGKQWKYEVMEYAAHLDESIDHLRLQLLQGSVDVGHYHYFTIHDPKERVICAAPFSERVLHHAIMNVCHSFFDRSLISDTYATRPGKGTYAALDRAKKAAARYTYMVKLDFRKYFDSIAHNVLKRQLSKKFKDQKLLNMFCQIIDSYNAESGTGLPIGNLTSQYFANMYLSEFDHLAKETLQARTYLRYMDDILIASDSKLELKQIVTALDAYARANLHLCLKPPLYRRSDCGIPFLGYRVMPGYCLLSGRAKRKFRSKVLCYDNLLAKGLWTEEVYAEHVRPLLAYTQHAKSWHFRKDCLRIAAQQKR